MDYLGGPAKDPTENVRQEIRIANERQDDLRVLNDRRIDAEIKLVEVKVESVRREMELRSQHHDKLQDIHAGYEERLRKTEAERTDSIRETIEALRQADREEVAKLAVVAKTTAETLSTALASSTSGIIERVSALELASSANQGKQTVVDPMIAQYMSKLDSVLTTTQTNTGKGEGSKATVAYVLAGASLLIALFMAFMTYNK